MSDKKPRSKMTEDFEKCGSVGRNPPTSSPKPPRLPARQVQANITQAEHKAAVAAAVTEERKRILDSLRPDFPDAVARIVRTSLRADETL